MVARDALGRPYRQTLVCSEGAVTVEGPSDEATGARGPLTNSRNCDPPLGEIDLWES